MVFFLSPSPSPQYPKSEKKLGRSCSEATKRKISTSMKGHFQQHPISEQTKSKMSEAARRRFIREQEAHHVDGRKKPPTKETKQKISATMKKKGAKSEATKKKMSEAAKRRSPYTEETRRKMSEAAKRRSPHTEETKRKISETKKRAKGLLHTEEANKKIVLPKRRKKNKEGIKRKMSETGPKRCSSSKKRKDLPTEQAQFANNPMSEENREKIFEESCEKNPVLGGGTKDKIAPSFVRRRSYEIDLRKSMEENEREWGHYITELNRELDQQCINSILSHVESAH